MSLPPVSVNATLVDVGLHLNLDVYYVKAYSCRLSARKGLGKLKEAMDGTMHFNPSVLSLGLIIVCVTVDS
jgi:hypothetical protein